LVISKSIGPWLSGGYYDRFGTFIYLVPNGLLFYLHFLLQRLDVTLTLIGAFTGTYSSSQYNQITIQ